MNASAPGKPLAAGFLAAVLAGGGGGLPDGRP